MKDGFVESLCGPHFSLETISRWADKSNEKSVSDDFISWVRSSDTFCRSMLPNSPCKAAIRSFFSRLEESVRHGMPEQMQLHFPYSRKRDLYDSFTQNFSNCWDNAPSFLVYFEHIWKTARGKIKGRAHSRFTKFSLRKELYNIMRAC